MSAGLTRLIRPLALMTLIKNLGRHTVPSTPWGRPSPPLCNTVRRGWCQPHDIVPPTSVQLTRRALEGGPAEPSSAFPMTVQDYAVTSGRRERSSPSMSTLCGHPRHCSAMTGTATTSPTLLERTGTGRRHACHCASYGPPLTAPLNRPVGDGRTANRYTTTLEVAPVRAQDAPRHPDWSKIRQDGRQLRGTACHASPRRRIVWHTCELLSPWPIKGRAIPRTRGT
jgi:hypothetical protein